MSNNADGCNCAPDEHNHEVPARPDYKPAEGSCLAGEIVKEKLNAPRFQWFTLHVFRTATPSLIAWESEEAARRHAATLNCHVGRVSIPPYV